MRLSLAAALALASASALGQDAPAAAVAIADLHAAAARKLENDDCSSFGAFLCGHIHKGNATLDWSASCRQAAQWRNLGRNYQGNAELVGKYKDAVSFWGDYCGDHSDWGLKAYEAADEAEAAEDSREAEAVDEAELKGQFVFLLIQCLMKNPDVAIAFAATVEAIEDKAMIEGALKAAMKTIGTSGNCPELKSFAESLYKEKPPNPMGNGG